MSRRTIWILFLVSLGAGAAAVLPGMDLRLPGNNRGYAPVQPIAFSHRLHAGDLEIDCRYCHADADRSRHAGIPSADACMNCHRFVAAPWAVARLAGAATGPDSRPARPVVSPEIAKLYGALGLGPGLTRDPESTARPVEWIRVHRLPAFVSFDHSRHVNAGVACETCHGAVKTMDRIRQVEDLSMGWCVQCHREAETKGVDAGTRPIHASTDCVVCHQ